MMASSPAGGALDGLFVWVWRADWHGEPPRATMRRCRDHGARGLFVRAWNGERATTPDGYSFLDQYRRYLDEASDLGTIIPWTYVYGPAAGNRPDREAHSFADAVDFADPPAVIVDIEHEGETREYGGQPDAARRLFGPLGSRFDRGRVGYTTYDLPRYHSLYGRDGRSPRRRDGIDYHGISAHAGFAIPQVYFADRRVRGAAALTRSREDWLAHGLDQPQRPAIQGYGITAAEALEVRARTAGFSIWRYDRIEPAIWDALARETPGVGAEVDDGWAAYRAEHARHMEDLAAGADAIRLANRTAAHLGRIPDDLAADYTRLNAHFMGRG